MPTYYRTDMARIQVSVQGITLDNVSWDVMQGGDNVAPSTNYPPGGMQPSVELGGVPKRNQMTVERIWSDTLIAAYKAMDAGAGRLPTTISYTVLDGHGNPVPGSTISYTGILLEAARPDYDSSSSAEAKLKITVGLNGPIN